MSNTPHELGDDFPGQADLIHDLKTTNAHFASLAEEKSLARNILAKIGRFFELSLGGSAKASAGE